ncbi:hypothetical protein CDD82_7282 [Ophiocordyceps australis]|uniref:Cyclin N-terminal domain-containing protein n=1 Tax=Ophiocordyceps australis TaxID=1399860 RepID=A0A2C5ZPU4_9HYPO|nr:hypothetical protein CDD82_7282 [Ophiocordyceps australis]
MKCEVAISPTLASASAFQNAPGILLPNMVKPSSALSIWSEASSQSAPQSFASSALSIWSEASSQSALQSCASDDSPCVTLGRFLAGATNHSASGARVPATELRRNPRRTVASSHGRLAAPPALVRQSDRKVNFVDSLVDSATQIVEAIWPLSSIVCRGDLGTKAVLPLRTFIQETLRRSRTSYSTLQVALYYLILVKPHVRASQHALSLDQNPERSPKRALHCGRRMFLAALILASKYLQDRNYSARAWSKISGLNTVEINQNELAFLLAVNWELHVPDSIFLRWTGIVLKHTPCVSPSSPASSQAHLAEEMANWKDLILKLDPNLTNLECLLPISTPSHRDSDLSILSPRSILNGPPREPSPAMTLGSLNPHSLAALQLSSASVATGFTPNPATRANYQACGETLLPTPRLTPQTSGLSTPAVSSASQGQPRNNAMAMAMTRACLKVAPGSDRFAESNTSSPHRYSFARRPSLANSASTASTASSPESMVSDSSRVSSLSSVSSLGSAGHHVSSNGACGVQSRFPVARSWNDQPATKIHVSSTAQEAVQPCFPSSPVEPCAIPTPRLKNLSLGTPLARRAFELDKLARDAMSEAARALQELREEALHATLTPSCRVSRKRGRSASLDKTSLPENVRDMLVSRGDIFFNPSPWSESMAAVDQLAAFSDSMMPSKRVCCSAEAATGHSSTSDKMHPAISMRGSRMWDGILN